MRQTGNNKFYDMKGDLLFKTLELLEKSSCVAADIIVKMATTSKSDYWKRRNFNPKAPQAKLTQELKKYTKERRKYYDLFYRLQRDGLAKKVKNRNNFILEITVDGLRKLNQFRNRSNNDLPRKKYDAEQSENLIIVSFDIPEKERRKRNWLRSALINLGFRMLQKSVWLAKVKIPPELLQDMRKLNLLRCVEIFSVGKTGTIKHVA